MMEPARPPLWMLVVTPLAVVAAFLVGVVVARRSPLPEPQRTALQLVHQEILRSYVDEVDPAQLLDRAIAAMANLDDYSEYVPPSDVAGFVEQTTGTYEGIGMAPYFAPDGVFVRIPFGDGPADRAGLLPGDMIVAIDGTTIDSLAEDERRRIAGERLRGAAGSRVAITVRRGGAERTIVVERGPVQKSSVKWAQRLSGDPDLGYVHLSDFHPGSSGEVERAITGLAQPSGTLRGLVLDLRFDGGGNLDECVALARMFLAKGNIVTLRRRGSEVVETFDADSTCPWPDLPLALLVNGSTASASEVFAGAMQDHHRAVVVGTATYGKGFVNTVFQWRDLDFRLKLTTAHYYTPDGRSLERDRRRRTNGNAATGSNGAHGTEARGGITPDPIVALDDAQKAAVRAALADQPFPEHHRQALTEWSKARGLRLPGILGVDEDPQLAAAVAALREHSTGGGAPTQGK